MTSKTTIGVFSSIDVFLWAVVYQRPWEVAENWDHPDAKKPDPQEIEEMYTAQPPLLRSLDNLLSISLTAAFEYLDLTVGVQVTVSDQRPDSVEFTDVEHWSEVSIRFEAHEDAEDWEGLFLCSYNDFRPSARHPELQALKIPPGITWRVRAEATTAPDSDEDFAIHSDQVTPFDYENGEGTWDTLPFQLKLWFWPEPELREPAYSPAQRALADQYVVAEQKFIKEWHQNQEAE